MSLGTIFFLFPPLCRWYHRIYILPPTDNFLRSPWPSLKASAQATQEVVAFSGSVLLLWLTFQCLAPVSCRHSGWIDQWQPAGILGASFIGPDYVTPDATTRGNISAIRWNKRSRSVAYICLQSVRSQWLNGRDEPPIVWRCCCTSKIVYGLFLARSHNVGSVDRFFIPSSSTSLNEPHDLR